MHVVVSVAAGKVSEVDGVLELLGVLAAALEEIDLPRPGPGAVDIFLGQEPDGRPETATLGRLGHYFGPAVAEGVVGNDPAGGIAPVLIALPNRLQHQLAVLDSNVFFAIRVVLIFKIK